jgi:Cu2+-containing amine oxidase
VDLVLSEMDKMSCPVKSNQRTNLHPLEPLSKDELIAAVKMVKEAKNLNDRWRFMLVNYSSD